MSSDGKSIRMILRIDCCRRKNQKKIKEQMRIHYCVFQRFGMSSILSNNNFSFLIRAVRASAYIAHD